MKYLKNFNTLQEYEDALILDKPNTSYIIENKVVKYSEDPKITNKYILYKSSDEQEVTPNKTDAFGVSLISNNYDDFGLLSFDGPVTSIGMAAFQYCSSLTYIAIPKSVTNIEFAAFSNCRSLTSITIPNSVTSIGQYAFYNCGSLASITCEATTPPTLGSSNNLSNVTVVYVPVESVDLYKTATNWAYYADKIKPI